MASPLFRLCASHPRLGSFALWLPFVGIRYTRWTWCQRRPVEAFADLVGLRRAQ